MTRVAGDAGKGVPHICHSEGRRGAGELSLGFQAALVLAMSLVGLESCLSNCLEVVVDRRGRDLGPRRLPLHLAAYILLEEQLNVGYFDPVASTLWIHGLFVACCV